MPNGLTWENAEDIGILLSETHPQLAPLEVRFADIQRYVSELPEFKDDSPKPDDAKLEAIQRAWQEEYEDRTQD